MLACIGFVSQCSCLYNHLVVLPTHSTTSCTFWWRLLWLNDTLYFSVTPAFTQWHLVPFSNTYIHSVTLCTFQRHLHSPIDTFDISVTTAFTLWHLAFFSDTFHSLIDIYTFQWHPTFTQWHLAFFSDTSLGQWQLAFSGDVCIQSVTPCIFHLKSLDTFHFTNNIHACIHTHAWEHRHTLH